MIFNVLILWLISTVALQVKPQSVRGSTTCYTPNNQNGICIPIRSCASLLELIQRTPLFPEERTFLRNSKCGDNQQQQHNVCCPNVDATTTPSPRALLPEPGVCGISPDIGERVLNGESTSIDEFPWMVLIEYSQRNNRKSFNCGGVLINDRYVLTAAHCVFAKTLKRLRWNLSSVRLGEWDTNSEEDCIMGLCSDPPIDVAVEEIIQHQNYNSRSVSQENDIALLRLSRSVSYTDFVKPICLPSSENLRNINYEGVDLVAAGWGQTENASFSNVKLKVKVPGVSNQRCNTVYNEKNVSCGPGQLCAGGIKGSDTCKGDSGGPLMAKGVSNAGKSYWYCAGIVSFGPLPCGKEGWPGVYTRVSSYIDWISQNIRP